MNNRVAIDIIDGRELRLLLRAGVAWLAHNADVINRMNVFPVPDGDTGINMYHTLKRAYQEIEPLNTEDVSIIAERFAYGALMGARGNSGTILSQILKGLSTGIGDHQRLTSQQMLNACKQSVELAYQSVKNPVEGTILTVARESYEQLESVFNEAMSLDEMLDVLTQAAEKSLYNTPNLLPVLKEAGVVDSGGMGLFFFLQGMQRFKNGERTYYLVSTSNSPSIKSELRTTLEPEDEDGYGYDVQFLMHGDGFELNKVRQDFEAMGWSVLVVGDDTMLKVHIHVHNPADPFNYAIGLGAELDDIVVENMQRQYQDYLQQRQSEESTSYDIPEHGIAVISVATGDGIQAVFRDLRCTHVISGGQTMNPSTEDFVNIINKLPTDKIILLPNNKNIILTAEQTARVVTDKEIRIIPSRSIMQGVSAMIAYGFDADNPIGLNEMVANMQDTIDYVRSIEVTRAIRSTEIDGKTITEGDYMGIVDGKIEVSHSNLDTTIDMLFDELETDPYELVTLYYGDDISAKKANETIERLSKTIKGLEFEVVYGGQPLYPFLISVE